VAPVILAATLKFAALLGFESVFSFFGIKVEPSTLSGVGDQIWGFLASSLTRLGNYFSFSKSVSKHN
jgi:ABC-type dipeptide/oligopeptide/nickel transport system permease subunit